jgi:hypothetical protein
MAGICGLYRVHGQRPDGIGKTALGRLHHVSAIEAAPHRKSAAPVVRPLWAVSR